MRFAASILLTVALVACTSDPAEPACHTPGYVETITHVDTLPGGHVVTALGEQYEAADCTPGDGACVCLDRWLE